MVCSCVISLSLPVLAFDERHLLRRDGLHRSRDRRNLKPYRAKMEVTAVLSFEAIFVCKDSTAVY